jgi:hypothetical protein
MMKTRAVCARWLFVTQRSAAKREAIAAILQH